MLHIHQESLPAVKPALEQAGAIGGCADDPVTMPELIQNLNAMAEHALRSYQQEKHKMSMISRLSSKQSELSGFAKQLLANLVPVAKCNMQLSKKRRRAHD
jgi:hypothetical protein